MFDEWLKNRREVKKLRIEKGSAVNRNVVIVCVSVLVIVLVIAIAVLMNSGGKLVTQAFVEHPELAIVALASQEHVDDTAIAATFLRNAAVQTKIGGSFTGRFTTKQERYLENANLSCIEQYTYHRLMYNASNWDLDQERLEDNRCTRFYVEKSYVRITYKADGTSDYEQVKDTLGEGGEMWKCPVFNCPMVERTREVMDTFIPEKVDLRNIELAADGNG